LYIICSSTITERVVTHHKFTSRIAMIVLTFRRIILRPSEMWQKILHKYLALHSEKKKQKKIISLTT